MRVGVCDRVLGFWTAGRGWVREGLFFVSGVLVFFVFCVFEVGVLFLFWGGGCVWVGWKIGC